MPFRYQPRYQPLTEYLQEQPPETTRVTLTFEQLGAVLGERLPTSAWGRSWWANTPHAGHARSWLNVGWRVVAVSVRGGGDAVTFERQANVDP